MVFLLLIPSFFLFRIDDVEPCDKLLDNKSNKKHLLVDHLNDRFGILIPELIDLLEKGLKERIVLLCPVPQGSPDETTVRLLLSLKSSSYFD